MFGIDTLIIYLVVMVVLVALAIALAPGMPGMPPPQQNSGGAGRNSTPGEVSFPKVTTVDTIPVIFGRVRINQPNVADSFGFSARPNIECTTQYPPGYEEEEGGE